MHKSNAIAPMTKAATSQVRSAGSERGIGAGTGEGKRLITSLVVVSPASSVVDVGVDASRVLLAATGTFASRCAARGLRSVLSIGINPAYGRMISNASGSRVT
jgi:hypothetical protein